MTQPTLRQRLRGLAATLVILLLVAGVPVLLIAIGAAPWQADLTNLPARLTAPDDGALAMIVIAVVAWIAWAVVAVSLVLEVIAQVRGLPAPSFPGLGGPQRAVGRLVAVAALLFIAAPTGVAAFPAPPAHAAVAAPVQPAAAPVLPKAAPVQGAPVLPQSAPVPASGEASPQERSSIDYTVKRGDSLWKIADRLLGDGARFPEIVDLNTALLNGRPDFITAGTVLKVPNHAPEGERAGEEYVVKAGDTLSEIADAELGDPTRYPELFEASRDTVQPDGSRLTDPDLIRPGWQITIPGQPAHEEKVSSPTEVEDTATPAPATQPRTEAPTVEAPSLDAAPAPTLAPAEAEPEIDRATAVDSDDAVEASGSGWLLPGLSGAGAVLASLVLLAVRAHRNTQLRYRRPGQAIAPPPAELRAVEKSAFASGAALTATLEQLNQALNHLAGACTDAGQARPPLVTATLASETVTLHLADDAHLPQPWTGAARQWSLRLDQSLPERPDVLPPYPMLVTIGRDDAGIHFLNLEHLGVMALRGDPDRTTALARHIAAELALNPWSTLVEVTLIGFGEELAHLDTLRLHHHSDGDQIVPSLVGDVTRSVEIGWGDPDPYRLILTTGAGTSELAPLLATPASWVGAALVSLSSPVPESTVIEVDHTGRLSAPGLGLDLEAAGLTSEEATACAAIVELTCESEPVTIAPFEEPTHGWRALADQAGALRQELTDVRDTQSPAGDASLLPNPSQDYLESAATTIEDIAALAPVVPEQVRAAVQEADPSLDEDLADWFDTTSIRPRLILLGAVNARAFGKLTPAITKRRPYFIEILAYLALHPKGATANEIADAFGIAASKARTDISSLRTWLGTNPRTGQDYLPTANESPAYRESGVKAYQLQDMLIDLDLFRRLRLRGQARGAAGIQDLKTAMALVEGPPFSALREKGWSWLLDTERIHETTGCAVVDTAHILITNALADGDLNAARQVAETACQAAPYDDIARLDLIKVTAAEGHDEAADKMLSDDIGNRTDDYLPPIELPPRTADVVGTQDWRNTRQRRRSRRA
ncbi:MAG: LysM peptidoglycan-binding domain-containing protein [Acidimicrobiales bacterium]|nr:LysM peptidoglycan-binding domain-containing protein [Acidimicrobiales bacterium]